MEAIVRAHARSVLKLRRVCAAAVGVCMIGAVAAATLGAVGAFCPCGLPGCWIRSAWYAAAALLGAPPLAGMLAWRAARPPRSPAVDLGPGDAPELYRMVAGLAAELETDVQAVVRLSPGPESWVEAGRERTAIVVGAPVLWWLCVSELRAMLAPLVAAAALGGHRQVVDARDFVRRLDRVRAARGARSPVGMAARLLLRTCHDRAEALEREIAWSARDRAQAVDPTDRVLALEQADLAAAVWQRLLTRLAMPAWAVGLWPDTLHAALVRGLTLLDRRDRRGSGSPDRLAEPPARALLRQPERLDRELSLLAADVYGPLYADRATTHVLPVSWESYPAQVTATVRYARARSCLDALQVDTPPRCSLRRLLTAAAAAARRAARDAEEHRRELLEQQVEAVLECALEAAGDHRWTVDWLDGAVLVGPDGRCPPLGRHAARVLDDGRVAEVCGWLTEWGVNVDAPVSATLRPAMTATPTTRGAS